MGPKKGNDNKPSKKAQKEKVEKRLEEQTFGMKNKNKSSKVQQFIATATKAAKNAPLYTDGEKAKAAKKAAQQAKLLQEEELRSLFNNALASQHGKSKAQKSSEAKLLGVDTQRKEVAEILDSISTDSESEDEIDDTSNQNVVFVNSGEGDDSTTAIEGVEVFREKTIEDIIEEQRAALQAEGKTGTPVNAETFAKWRAAKLAKRQAAAEARVKAESLKKKGGKGLSVLSGKELFNFNSSLFVDDNSAISAKEEQALTAETQVVTEKEDAQVNAERDKIMKDQEMLMEIYRLEEEEHQRKMSKWRTQCDKNYKLAKNSPADTNGFAKNGAFVFHVGGTVVNGYVFAVSEEEQLEIFEGDETDLEDAAAPA